MPVHAGGPAASTTGGSATPSSVPTGVPTLGRVRLTHFRQLMDDEFGAVRAGSIARDHVFGALGSRTVAQALEDGDEPRDVWRAVCAEFDVPAERR